MNNVVLCKNCQYLIDFISKLMEHGLSEKSDNSFVLVKTYLSDVALKCRLDTTIR